MFLWLLPKILGLRFLISVWKTVKKLNVFLSLESPIDFTRKSHLKCKVSRGQLRAKKRKFVLSNFLIVPFGFQNYLDLDLSVKLKKQTIKTAILDL